MLFYNQRSSCITYMKKAGKSANFLGLFSPNAILFHHYENVRGGKYDFLKLPADIRFVPRANKFAMSYDNGLEPQHGI